MNYWWLVMGLWLTSGQVVAARRALLIGIGTYPAGRPGTSAVRDQYYMTQILSQQQFSDLTSLTNERATAGRIRDALNQLLRRCKPGDKVVIHYAGHGTQLPDQNGDERDHYDEALVPFDAPRPGQARRSTPDPFIRDDEIALFLSQLRSILGPEGHALLLIDACHSGTLMRGRTRLRTDHYKSQTTSAPIQKGSDWLDVLPAFNRAMEKSGKIILMAGSQAGEDNYETTDDQQQAVGSLTYGFSRAMNQISATDTYQSLFDRVKTEMRRKAPEQRPALEGDGQELVWAGEVISASIRDSIKRIGRHTILLAKGLLAGYQVGSLVNISRGNTGAVRGEVIESSLFSSRILLKDSLWVSDSLDLRVRLISQSIPGLLTTNRIVLLRDLSLPDAALQATMTLQNARLTADHEHLRDTLPTATDRKWPVFRPGQQAWLTITNTGKSPFYFALVDIQPDGITTTAKSVLLLPNDDYTAADTYLIPGQEISFPVSLFTPPYGLETYKLLLTSTPADWSLPTLARSNQAPVDSQPNPFTYLLNGPARGLPRPSFRLEETGVSTLHFWIKPPRKLPNR